MSKFLDFLRSMDVLVPTAGDVIKSTLFSPQARPSATGIPDTVPTLDAAGENEPESWYTNGEALIYPQDLFDLKVGDQFNHGGAHIVFMIREPTVQSSKLLKRIALYMPPSIKVDYGANWEDISLATINRSNESYENIINEVKTRMGNRGTSGLTKSTLSDFTNILSGAVQGGIAGLVDDATFGKQVLAKVGVAINPHAAQKFNTISFRKFAFNFQLFARTKKESETIRQIVKMFKWAMHPSALKSSFSGLEKIFWDYPNTFDILLFTPGTKYMFNIAQSALTDMSVTYGDEGSAFFKETGAPAQVNLSLSFTELEILTKQRIQQNY